MTSATFFDLLQDLRDGGVVTELDAAIREVVHAVTLTGRRGEVRLTVQIKPAAKNNRDLLTVEDRIECRPPKLDRVASFVYPLPDGSLSRKDPRQPDLPNLRELAPVSPFPRDLDEVGDADAQPRYRGEGGIVIPHHLPARVTTALLDDGPATVPDLALRLDLSPRNVYAAVQSLCRVGVVVVVAVRPVPRATLAVDAVYGIPGRTRPSPRPARGRHP